VQKLRVYHAKHKLLEGKTQEFRRQNLMY